MDRGDFDKIVIEKYGYLMKVAEAICGYNDAPDAVAEALAYVWEHKEFDDVGGALVGRTRQRAMNTARDNERRAQYEVLESDAGMSIEDLSDARQYVPSVEDQFIAQEESALRDGSIDIYAWAASHVPPAELAVFKALKVEELGMADAERKFGYTYRHLSRIADRVANTLKRAAIRDGLV